MFGKKGVGLLTIVELQILFDRLEPDIGLLDGVIESRDRSAPSM